MKNRSFGLLMWSMTQPSWVQWIVDRYFAAYDWCERVRYAHHNARVLSDMEYRFGCVLCAVTNGMSKAYYDKDTMLAEIADKQNEDARQAIEDFITELDESVFGPVVIKELCEAAGVSHDDVLKERARLAEMYAALEPTVA